MDFSARRRALQSVLSESLSLVRKFGETSEPNFSENVTGFVERLRELANQLEDPQSVPPNPEFPGYTGYSLWAEDYDNLDGNPVVAAEGVVLNELIGEVAGLRVLDVGCGTGRHSIPLAESGAQVMGVDPTPEMLEKAKSKAEKQGMDVDFRGGSIEDVGPELGNYDIVLCCLVLSHVKHLADAVGRLADRLAPGGRLIITDFHPVNILVGFRTSFTVSDTKYIVPNYLHLPSDYFTELLNQGLNLTAFHEIGAYDTFPGFPQTLILMAEKPETGG